MRPLPNYFSHLLDVLLAPPSSTKHQSATMTENSDTDDEDDVLSFIVAVDGRQLVNVALHRPAYMISTYSDTSGVHHANRANDGKRDPVLGHLSCAHTLTETNPWWAVDLLMPLYVGGVNFTNRYRASTYA